MREIKFRLWSRDFKVMEYNPAWEWQESVYGLNDGIKAMQELEYEVMQYTGLKDENGKEIYEGDILQGWSKLDLVEVMYINAGFWFVSKGKALQKDVEPTINSINEHEYEVIGNIYENPELLK